MAVVPFPVRNKLAYPAGTRAGIDPSHPAAQNLGFSVVRGAGPKFVNLTSALITPFVGGGSIGPPVTIDGALGPSCIWANRTVDVGMLASASVATPVAGTFAVMIRPFALSSGQYFTLIVSDSDGCMFFIQSGTTALTPNMFTNGHNRASFDLTLGAPYFLVYSGSLVNTGIGYFVAKNLSTGELLQSKITIASTYIGTGGTLFDIGNDTSVTTGANANIAAAMYSPNLALGLPQLVAWANDPWAFWYPNQVEMLVAAAAATPTTTLYSLINW